MISEPGFARMRSVLRIKEVRGNGTTDGLFSISSLQIYQLQEPKCSPYAEDILCGARTLLWLWWLLRYMCFCMYMCLCICICISIGVYSNFDELTVVSLLMGHST